MKKTAVLAVSVLLASGIAEAQAQSISPAWNAYRKGQKPATTQPQAQPAQGSSTEPPSQYPQSQATGPAQATSTPSALGAPVPSVPPPSPHQARRKKPLQDGFFAGVQAGQGWVYEDVRQDFASGNFGYRWLAGDVSLVGFELGGGRLDQRTTESGLFPSIRYANIGANARFNFGERNPWFAIARLGYWTADDDVDVDGAYASFGIGVDANRHFSVSLVYTRYAYATDYYYNGDYYDTEINSADTVTLGIEGRF
ncbi:hypothetical protein [Pseudoxanthomonas sp. J35]|uniref:hypothetical protein n=1 Tax=Pseudoxanthomonas sp. J35 TaxID=935852 RepID=UPI0004912F76|nr:hypothetical protein [Pseudoxanthomonas sp. J35]